MKEENEKSTGPIVSNSQPNKVAKIPKLKPNAALYRSPN